MLWVVVRSASQSTEFFYSHETFSSDAAPNYKHVKYETHTVELQWLEHLWDHRKLLETWVVRATEG